MDFAGFHFVQSDSFASLPVFQKITYKIFSAGGVAVTLALLILISSHIELLSWDNSGSKKNGYPLNFALGFTFLSQGKPEGYSPEAVDLIAKEYEQTDKETTDKQPNVVVIMCESFSDFDIIGDLKTNIPVTPYIDSLKENTVKGYALCSVFGGRTANSEFEVLTGHTMAFYPTNSVPYQQYIHKDAYSLSWLFKSMGYQTHVTHPYRAKGWARDSVCPHLGFEKCSFIESYPQENKIRNYVSDQEMFEVLLEGLKNDEKNKPTFTYGITMQNHGGYAYKGDNYTQTVNIEGMKGNYPEAEQHLTLINETDKAVEYLLTELESFEEDTVVLFFGDHYPKIEEEFYQELYGGKFNKLSEQIKQYQMPFFIWANYDIEEREIECTSFNYLSRYLFETLDMELTEYHTFLKDMEEVIPSMNAMGYYSKEKGDYIEFDKATGKEKEMLDKYKIVQYNNIFDQPNEIFYNQYIN